MAERYPSEANNVQLAASPTTTVRAVLGIRGAIEDWMPCDRCGCGALAHGYDEPAQRCLCGRCTGYRAAKVRPTEKSRPSNRP